jgi:hypothetical protein
MRKFLLSIFTIFTMNAIAQDCSELFISEYVEGPYNNNAIEIYNPTSSSIDLAGYTINRYSNGSTDNPEVWQLSGSIASADVIVVGNGQLDSVDLGAYWSIPVDPTFYSVLDDHCNGDYDANSTFYFNGDDAMTLEYSGNIVDIFGKVGEDPGAAWTDDASAAYTDANGATWWTKRKTLVRKPSVKKGVTMNPPLFFIPTLEYDSLPDATYTGMGSHTCDCSNASSIYENKSISFVTSPNPANKGSIVTLNSNVKIDRIDVVNILGEKVLTQISNKITTTNLARGTYIINILFSDGRIVDNKLIIK